jgi:hypothetical protein
MGDRVSISGETARRLALKWGGWWAVVLHHDDTLAVVGGRGAWLRLARLPVVASWWSHEAGAVCDGACRVGTDGPAWDDEFLPNTGNNSTARARVAPAQGWERSTAHY